MSDTAVISVLAFVLFLVLFLSFRYHEEMRALFGRLEKFRADRRGIESTFSPPLETMKVGTGSPAEPPTADGDDELERPEPADADEKVDLPTTTDLDVLHREMVRAAFGSDRDRATDARNRFREVCDDPGDVARADALFDAVMFDITGDQEFLKCLRDRAMDPRAAAYVEYLIGMALENVKQHAEAADAYARALATAKEPEFRASLVGSRAKMLTEIGKADLAENEVKVALRDESDPAAKASLWRALADVYEAREQYFEQAFALQEVRVHEPKDSGLCFSIAWALGQTERAEFGPLAIHFYRLAIFLDSENEYALNNLGWEYSKAGLPIKAAHYYSRAADVNNTLAMANLAGMKLKAGFAEEAEEILRKAQAQETVHENVASVQADISRARSGESEKAASLEKSGPPLAEFCSKAAHAELWDRPAELPRRWRWATGGSVDLSLRQGKLTLEWTVDEAPHKIEADLCGRSARGDHLKMGSRFSAIKRERIETGWEKEHFALLVLDGDDAGIEIALFNGDGAEFRRLEAGESQSDSGA